VPGSDEIPAHVPTRIGAYRLLRTIGEGGMGIVFLAEQDEPVQRQVAIKLMKQSIASPQARSRFDAEREALSRMRHSHIATIHDAGSTEDDRPYFVMELVQGTPMDRYCDTERLSIRDRIELFIRVCGGVHHAHQKGIVHRDLKPSNLLVRTEGGKPVPKIIDFGIAKMVLDAPEERPHLTHSGQLVGTPEFMSPEQALGLDVDTRSDVYSLGVVLYQLLSGALPVDRDRLLAADYAEARRLLLELDPDKPSTRVSSAAGRDDLESRRFVDSRTLARCLRGDLDAIVMKALEKDPVWRYDSAAALGSDLQRYLDGEPVLARTPTVRYRTRKFVRRHRGAVFGAGVALGVLIVGLVVSSYYWFLAQQRYDDVVRLSDLKRLSDYLAEAEELWPAHPDRIDDLKEWIDKAETLAERLPLHEETLAAIKTRLAEEGGQVFETQWQLGNLEQLVKGLQSFRDSDPHQGALASVRERLTFAREVIALSIDSHSEAWAEATRSIADPAECPEYGGLRLPPQIGLVPLGRDPDSNLWEFAHLQTGEIPGRGVDGRLVFTEESGIVLVLVPGGTFRMGSSPASLGLDLDTSEGRVLVRRPTVGSHGQALGFREGDVILAVGEERVTDGESYRAALSRMMREERLVITVERDGQHLELELDPRPLHFDPDHDRDESPVHLVTLSSFFLSKYEMTQGQWQRFVGSNPSQYQPVAIPPRTLLNPVEHVTWFQCRDILARLDLVLPTEAQWEYTARAGASTPWWTGWDRESLAGAGNLADAYLEQNGGNPGWPYERGLNDGWATHAPVGSFRGNAWGFHDTVGNVSEWCLDAHGDYRNGFEARTGARMPPFSAFHIVRNASWFLTAVSARSAARDKSTPERLDATLGVRPSRAVNLTPR
jgi:serine/threonine protein kinase/formylglycine-generating enzyme required for sulfatase activity